MSVVSDFSRSGRGWSRRASVQLPSVASEAAGEASGSEGVSESATGLTGKTASVSESGVWTDEEQDLDDSVAFRFSAGKDKARE